MVLSSYAGAAVRRKEDPRLITGASTYVDDITLPNLVHAAFVRSPYAHAKINGVDASEALAMPGVIAVFTESDIRTVMPEIYPRLAGDTGQEAEEVAEEDEASIPVPDVYPLAWDKVRYVGEPVAVVIAETKAQAEDAASMVVIDAEPLDAVIDPYEATEDGAPLIYDNVKNNISVREATVHGDVEAALNSAAGHGSRPRSARPRCAPMPMEGRAVRGHAGPDHARPDRLDLDAGAALEPQRDRQGARAQPDPGARDRAGGRRRLRRQDRRLPGGLRRRRLARLLKRPVKWIETRSENFLATNHGRNQIGEFEVGARRRTARSRRCKRARPARLRRLPEGARPAPGATWVMSTGAYDIPERRLRGRRRLHQHHGERRLSRRGPAGGGLLPRARDGYARRRGWAWTRSRSGARTSSRPTRSPTRP